MSQQYLCLQVTTCTMSGSTKSVVQIVASFSGSTRKCKKRKRCFFLCVFKGGAWEPATEQYIGLVWHAGFYSFHGEGNFPTHNVIIDSVLYNLGGMPPINT